jgi:hypothetical protein
MGLAGIVTASGPVCALEIQPRIALTALTGARTRFSPLRAEAAFLVSAGFSDDRILRLLSRNDFAPLLGADTPSRDSNESWSPSCGGSLSRSLIPNLLGRPRWAFARASVLRLKCRLARQRDSQPQFSCYVRFPMTFPGQPRFSAKTWRSDQLVRQRTLEECLRRPCGVTVQ